MAAGAALLTDGTVRRRLYRMTETLTLADIDAVARDCLARAGMQRDRAAAVARDVTVSEAIADRSNGLCGLLRDLRLIRYGHLDPSATPVVTIVKPGLLHVDATHGFAATAVSAAVSDLTMAARRFGVARLVLTRSSAPGSMGGALGDIADAGLSALVVPRSGAMRLIRPGDALPRTYPAAADRAEPAEADPSPFSGRPDDCAWLTVSDAQTDLPDMADAAIWSGAAVPTGLTRVSVPSDLLADLIGA